jgi:hypothetical protein
MSTLEATITPNVTIGAQWSPPTEDVAEESLLSDGAIKFDLACELQELLGQILTAAGLSKEAQELAATGNHKVIDGVHDRPSTKVMRNSRAISTILATWKTDKRFLAENGDPAVLPIAGSGRTLESIVRMLKIDMSLEEIVQKLCELGDVSRIDGDRVGLLGTSAVIYRNNPVVTLAAVTTHLRRMIETTLLNMNLPRERRAEGLFQRNVSGVIPLSKFAAFAEAIRPRLQEICDEMEERISAEGSIAINNETDDLCGFEIFLFREGYKTPPTRKRLQKLPSVKALHGRKVLRNP